MRLDSLITEKFNLKSRTYASRLIKDGFVKVNNKTVLQPSKEVDGTEDFEILKEESFASFGGEKLKKAIEQFGISVADKYCVDVGCSNGGFTDCLLKEGAKKIKKKADDLVAYAVKKGTPVIEAAAKEVKESTIKTLESITAKLKEEEPKKLAKSSK